MKICVLFFFWLYRCSLRKAKTMEQLVEFVAKALVENPDEVEVSQRSYRDRIVVRLSVDPEDTGRVIGKGGRVANAIRTVMRVAAANDGRDATLKIL